MMYKHLTRSRNGTARAAAFGRSYASRATGATSPVSRAALSLGPSQHIRKFLQLGITESQEEQ